VGLRRLRVNEALKETLSTVIAAEGLKDPRVGFVTVTGVNVSPDLRHAKVFVSVLGPQAQREATMAALSDSRGYLQSRLAASLRLKRTPQLQFIYDDTLDNAMHIAALMAREEQVLGSEPREILVGGEEPEAGEPAEQADDWDDEAGPADDDDWDDWDDEEPDQDGEESAGDGEEPDEEPAG
jgi:ribosome-binding factor A